MTASNFGIFGRLFALAIPLGVFLSLAACKVDDGPTGLLIRQDQYLEPGGSENCVLSATATEQQRVEGTLDVTIPDVSRNGYLFYPLVENQLGPFTGVASTGTASPAEEKNSIMLKAFHVSLSVENRDSFSWPDDCSGDFDYPVATQVLPPGGTVSAFVKLIRPCNAKALFDAMNAEWNASESANAMVVNARIRAKGHLGSGNIESPPFDFMVTACFGCLQSGYTQTQAAAFQFPNIAKCSDLDANPYLGEPCNSAQDQLILCCADSFDAQGQATSIHCPAPSAGTSGH
jgi:hypothetical protein